MIRQWAIAGALGAVLLFLSWGFTRNVLMYDPMDGFDLQGTTVQKADDKGMKRGKAWGPEIKSRNLFSPARVDEPVVERNDQSVVPVAQEFTTPPLKMPAITLSGIIKNHDGSYTAYVKVGKNPVTGARVGDVFHGVSVETIEERKVELDWNGNKVSLQLKSSPLIKKR